MYKPEVAGFPDDKEKDQYTCPRGKPLPFKGFDHTAEGRLIKNYWAAPKDCSACSLKATCAPNTRCRKIAYDPGYWRAYGRQQSGKGKRMKQLRQSTVEPVFGSLIHYYDLRRIGVRGKTGASKVLRLAAPAFNLKKYLKFKPVKVASHVIALQQEPRDIFNDYFIAFTRLFFN